MTVMINQTSAKSYLLSTDKNTVEVIFGTTYTNVLVKNASHAVYRGSGRHFHFDTPQAGLNAAIDAYKSADVKGALGALLEYIR